MASCHEMKKGEIYVCEECGLELQVLKECRGVGKPEEESMYHTDDSQCALACCGKDLVKKKT